MKTTFLLYTNWAQPPAGLCCRSISTICVSLQLGLFPPSFGSLKISGHWSHWASWAFRCRCCLERSCPFFNFLVSICSCLMLKWTIADRKPVLGWNFTRVKFLDTVVTMAIWLTWHQRFISCILHWRYCCIEIAISITQNLTSEFRSWLTHFSAFEWYLWLCFSLSSMYISPTVPTPLTCTLQLTSCTFHPLQSLGCEVPS
jgi:hypothetical protein